MKKDIPGYNNYYADTEGNIYSKDRFIKVYNTRTKKEYSFFKKGIKLIPHLKSNGYYVVTLCENNKHVEWLVHRLIALTFIPNPNNLPHVNHKDENKLNNNINNLEWCTPEYNYYYGTGLKKRKTNQKVKAIKQYRIDGSYVASYPSINNAARTLNIKHYNIIACCKGKRKTAGGYIWKYEKTN